VTEHIRKEREGEMERKRKWKEEKMIARERRRVKERGK
jgi:hypothetical protein